MTTDHTQSAKPHVLACLALSPSAPLVARKAKRLADLLGAEWEAVNVARPEDQRASKAAREALLEGFRVAEELGAATRSLNGDDPAAELLVHARRQGATHLAVGASSRPAWTEIVRSSTLRRLVEGAGDDIAIEVVPGAPKKAADLEGEALRPPSLGDPGAYVAASAFVALATAFAVPVHRALALPNISLIFVLAVIAAAARYGAAVAVFTAILSSLAYNFFLTEPYYTFVIADPANVWAVFFFLVVGLAVSAVAAHARAQTRIARRQAQQSADLQAFAHLLVGTEEESDIAGRAAETASKLLYARAVVFGRGDSDLEMIAEIPGPEMLGGDDIAAANLSLAQRMEAGHGVAAMPEARWLFIPLPGEREPVGVIGVRPFDDATRLDPEQRRILDLVADLTGVALDRARLARVAANPVGK
jgi:two-component system sensor histidine kinase KdpD